MRNFNLVSRKVYRDNEGAGKEGEEKPKTFTQEEVNGFLAEERKKQTKLLEDAKNRAGTTEKEKTALQKQIDDLKASYQTKEESLVEQHAVTLKDLETKLKASDAASVKWRDNYAKSVFTNQTLAAAVAKEAFNPELVVTLLEKDMELIETVDGDGAPSGNFEPRIKLTKKNKDGKEVILKVTPAEAVEAMVKDVDRYGSLFKSTAKSGTGSNNGTGSGGSNNGTFEALMASGDKNAAREAYRKEYMKSK